MKKIMMFLLMCLSLLCSQKANGQTVDTIPVSITYDSTNYIMKINRIDTSYEMSIDTIKKLEPTLVTSVIVKRSFGEGTVNGVNETYTKLTLEDGYVVRVSSAHNFTIVQDIIGSEYTYWSYVMKDGCKINYDTILHYHYDTLYNGDVNLACDWVSMYYDYWDRKTKYYAKVYSYYMDKKYLVDVDIDFYLKYLNSEPHSKKYYKKNNITISFFDFLMIHSETVRNNGKKRYYDFVIIKQPPFEKLSKTK